MEASTIHQTIDRWHAYLQGDEPDGLESLLADDVVFYSPIIYTPQAGKAVTALYLEAAKQTLPGSKPTGDGSGGTETAFRYVKQVLDGDTAVLEFETSASKEGFSARAQLLASKGWVVFEPNYRGREN